MPSPDLMKTTLLIDKKFGFTSKQQTAVYAGLKDANFENVASMKRMIIRLMHRDFPGDDGYVMVSVVFPREGNQTTCFITVARANR